MLFRTEFKLPYKIKNWFPGHMVKGMKQMERTLKNVDCVLEIHDARIPFSGRNRNFRSSITAIKPHILLLNKMDLADLTSKHTILNKLKSDGVDKVIYLSATGRAVKGTGCHQILPTVIDLIKSSDRFNRSDAYDFSLMVIGIPNVGKSSLINKLRNLHMESGSPAIVGKVAGVTRSVMEKIKINVNPPVYLYDTPGILEPRIDNLESFLRCALCGTVSDNVIGEEIIADYLLYWLNKHNNFSYVDHLKIEKPSDNITEVLVKVCVNNGYINEVRNLQSQTGLVKRPNLQTAAIHFIKSFREGHFGRVMLDQDLL